MKIEIIKELPKPSESKWMFSEVPYDFEKEGRCSMNVRCIVVPLNFKFEEKEILDI